MPIAPSSLDPIRRAAAVSGRRRRIAALPARRCPPQGLRDVDGEACAPVRP